MEDWNGPWCIAALFCEELKQRPELLSHDPQGVFNQIFARVGSNSYDCILLLRFVKGDADGIQQLKVRAHQPDGIRTDLAEMPFVFPEGLIVFDVATKVNIPLVHPGTVWYEIVVNDRLLTRTACRVRYHDLPDRLA